MKNIYFDCAATTPLDPAVFKAMAPYQSDIFANPGSLHQPGQQASAAIFSARRSIATPLKVPYTNIIFTGSATEANNLALRGAVKRAGMRKPKIIISAFEHESILDTAEDLEQEGVEVIYLPVSRSGFVDLKKLQAELDENVVLVSLMHVNNEVGTIQPIQEAANIIKAFKKDRPYPLFHSDSVQAFQYLPCIPEELGLDLMTLSAHKIYGPKGIGLLYVKDAQKLSPIITGGGQERGLRSATENTPAIVGFGKAMELIEKKRKKETLRVSALRDDLLKGLKRIFSKLRVNGSLNKRIANNLNCSLPKISSEKALTFFDLQGIAISAGPACSARSLEPSKTLLAMGLSKEAASESIRISLGKMTKKSDIKAFVLAAKQLKKSFGA